MWPLVVKARIEPSLTVGPELKSYQVRFPALQDSYYYAVVGSL
jgi:hypothetical protein